MKDAREHGRDGAHRARTGVRFPCSPYWVVKAQRWLESDGRGPCPYCEAPEDVITLRDWEEGAEEGVTDPDVDNEVYFMWDSCCQAMSDAIQWIEEHPQRGMGWEYLLESTWLKELFKRELGWGRRLYYDTGTIYNPFRVDWDVRVELLGGRSSERAWTSGRIRRNHCQEFINEHHRHNQAPPGWLWAHALFNGTQWIGVVWVGRPVARMTATKEPLTVEVNRMCINHGLSNKLTYKAASLGYNSAVREAMRRGYRKVTTFTLANEESGISLRYANRTRPKGTTPWVKDGPPTQGGSWDREGRRRDDTAPTVPKQRWATHIIPHDSLPTSEPS